MKGSVVLCLTVFFLAEVSARPIFDKAQELLVKIREGAQGGIETAEVAASTILEIAKTTMQKGIETAQQATQQGLETGEVWKNFGIETALKFAEDAPNITG